MVEPWTTYIDSKSRKWVIIDLIPFNSDGVLCETTQFVRTYLVGSHQHCPKIPILEWEKAVDEKLLIKD